MKKKRLGTGEPGYRPIRKMRTMLNGLRDAVVFDFSVAYKVVVSAAVLTAAFFLRTWVDFLLVLVVTGFVLALEIVNSAIEALCDFVEAEHNEKIRIIKDMAAAAAGIAIFVWLIVLGFEAEEMLRAFVTGAES